MTLHMLADANGEVSHDTLLTLMMGMFGIAITSPIFVMLIQSRQTRRDRSEDRQARQHVARRLEESDQRTTKIASEVAERNEHNLNLIHKLVNSNLTKTMEGERAAIEQALGAMTEAISMKLAQGVDVLPETYAAQAKLDEQLNALNLAIADRHETMQQLIIPREPDA